jgi:membrane protease YdiL (CAAX protease family)
MKGFLPRTLHPILQLFLLVGLMVAGACVALTLIAVYASARFGFDFQKALLVAAQPQGYAQGWELAVVMQGLLLFSAGTVGALGLASLLGYRWAEYFNPRRLGAGWWLLAAAGLIVVVLPAMSGLIAWNAGVHFPAFLHDFEVWARAKEEQAQVLTRFFTRFTGLGRFVVALVVMALVPAVAEELVFRGVIQRNLVRWFNSRHVGIWLGAALFSAIHLQFFGFVPRFVLGLVLGYLYEWSGNILVPMAAHFTQNAFQLVMLYLAQRGHFGWGFDPESTEALPWPLVLLSAGLSAGLLYFLHQRLTAAAVPTQMLTLSHDGVAVRHDEPLA